MPAHQDRGLDCGDDNRRMPAEFTGDHQLLRVAAGQQGGFLPDVTRALHIVFADRSRGVALHGSAIKQAERAIAAGADLGDGEIIGERQAALERIV